MGLIFVVFIVFFWKSLISYFSFGSKTLKTHQIDGFRSRGPSKNARGYRFHAYKWSKHHITGWKNKIIDFYKVPETS